MPWDATVPDCVGKASGRHKCANWKGINEWVYWRALTNSLLCRTIEASEGGVAYVKGFLHWFG